MQNAKYLLQKMHRAFQRLWCAVITKALRFTALATSDSRLLQTFLWAKTSASIDVYQRYAAIFTASASALHALALILGSTWRRSKW